MIALILSLLLNTTHADLLKIAVIDTGSEANPTYAICKGLARNFTRYPMFEHTQHGDTVASVLAKRAGKKGYCIVPIKFWHPKVEFALNNFIKALKYAYEIKADIINISVTGLNPSLRERAIVKKILDTKTIIITSSGNDGLNLDLQCNVYPACYDARMVVVGSLDSSGKRAESSNYGLIVDFEKRGKGCYRGLCLFGTSFAAPRVAGDIVKYIVDKRSK